MNKKVKTYLYLLAGIILVVGCSPSENKSDNREHIITSNKAPEDFQEFYINFHTDTNYQLSHITFPLQGQPTIDTSTINGVSFRWKKEDWKWHSLDNFDANLYEVTRNIIDSTLIAETIREKKSGMGIKRRFARFNGEWFLIYYSAMNPLQ
ncbi:DUF4348 domain-containing protein [Membranihabitans maritimus]|uniref:DUF4348 domain-containing protein n=1 Tax=Membranihabitans maritimus TaxID=2904244 RepID=UPI001F3649F8|nr:DUF4348 domain-containing protein [Membranihabitans maritimus]